LHRRHRPQAAGLAGGSPGRGRGRGQRAPASAERARRGPRAETELRAIDERYQLALRGCQDGLWEWDLGSDRCSSRRAGRACSASNRRQIADDKAGWLGRVHPDDRAACEAALGAPSGGSEAQLRHEMRLVHKDGSVRHVLSRGVAIRRESGAPYRLVGLDTDVTRLKRVQTVLDAVAEGTSGASAAFFQAMVRHFARALDVERAFITECADDADDPRCARSRSGRSKDGTARTSSTRSRARPAPRSSAEGGCASIARAVGALPARGRLAGVPRHADHRQRRPHARPPRLLRLAAARRRSAGRLDLPDLPRPGRAPRSSASQALWKLR
jgi:hypothetical protein